MGSVDIKDNSVRVLASANQRSSLSLRLILDAIEREARPNTPKELGDLRNNVTKQVLGNKASIKWGQRYAVYQEEKQHKNYTTPGTGPHFARNAVKKVLAELDSIISKVRQ